LTDFRRHIRSHNFQFVDSKCIGHQVRYKANQVLRLVGKGTRRDTRSIEATIQGIQVTIQLPYTIQVIHTSHPHAIRATHTSMPCTKGGIRVDLVMEYLPQFRYMFKGGSDNTTVL